MIERARLLVLLDEWGEWDRGGDLHGYPKCQPFAKMVQCGDARQVGYMPEHIDQVNKALARLRLWSLQNRTPHWNAIKRRHKYNMADCVLTRTMHRSQFELDALFNSAYLRVSAHLDKLRETA